MILLFKIICITVIWVLGIKLAASKDMVLYFITRYAETKKSKIWEPIILCEWCMPSLHSLIGFLFAFLIGVIPCFSISLVWMYPLVVLGSSVICGTSWKIIELITMAEMYYRNEGERAYLDVKDKKKAYNQIHRNEP